MQLCIRRSLIVVFIVCCCCDKNCLINCISSSLSITTILTGSIIIRISNRQNISGSSEK